MFCINRINRTDSTSAYLAAATLARWLQVIDFISKKDVYNDMLQTLVLIVEAALKRAGNATYTAESHCLAVVSWNLLPFPF